jgi:hypothetical protein
MPSSMFLLTLCLASVVYPDWTAFACFEAPEVDTWYMPVNHGHIQSLIPKRAGERLCRRLHVLARGS